MNRSYFLTAVATSLLILCGNSNAALVKALEDAYELPASHVLSVSDKDKGDLVFKRCSSCEATRAKMTASTYFEVNRRQVSKAAFWSAVRRSKGNVYLFVDIKTGNVSRVKLDG